MPLDKKATIGSWIKDFQKSDAPQFKGHSKEKRRDQAIAAYFSAKKEGLEEGNANTAWKGKMPGERRMPPMAAAHKDKYDKKYGKLKDKHGKIDFSGKPNIRKYGEQSEGVPNPHRNLTKQQSLALRSSAARAKPKSQVSLAPTPWDKKKKEKKETVNISKRPELPEGTWHMPDQKQIAILRNLMKKPIKLGKEGDAAVDLIPIGDDELHDNIYAAGMKNPNGDARPVIQKWFKRRIKDNSYGLGAKTKQLANKIGLKEEAYEDDFLYESTNWKGGSQHIGLARYSARNGYGVQITQIKAMPGDKMNWANGAGFCKLPVKDIPKLCKALMNVYKAPANVQLGDDD